MTSRERVLLALTIVGFAAPNVIVGCDPTCASASSDDDDG
jgi:hypothetical protein